MVFAEALTEYLIDGLSEALAQAEEPAPPVPLPARAARCRDLTPEFTDVNPSIRPPPILRRYHRWLGGEAWRGAA